ncbi:aminotransferase class I/II-fold pyridoxal phosphate-dependent enzyme, partial [Nocardioides sp.]
MTQWSDWLTAQAEARDRAGLTRRLRSRPVDDPTIDLAGNDYLGLARDPAVTRAAADAALAWGAGAASSRLVTGTLDLHAELESELAEYLGQPAALVLSTGYQANLAVVTALADRTTHVLSDAHIHASLVDAVRLSRAQLTVVPHSDIGAVVTGLEAAAAAGERAMVLVESVYSVLGDAAPLRKLASLCLEYDALLIVDEAHGLGVHGPGLVASLELAGLPHVVVTATLSKSLGAQGGAVLGSVALREHLVNRARPFIFDTALAPAATAGALAALRQLIRRPELADV